MNKSRSHPGSSLGVLQNVGFLVIVFGDGSAILEDQVGLWVHLWALINGLRGCHCLDGMSSSPIWV